MIFSRSILQQIAMIFYSQVVFYCVYLNNTEAIILYIVCCLICIDLYSNCYYKDIELLGLNDSIADMALASQAVDPGSIAGTTYGLPSPVRSNPECRVMNKPWALLDMVPNMTCNKDIPQKSLCCAHFKNTLGHTQLFLGLCASLLELLWDHIAVLGTESGLAVGKVSALPAELDLWLL